MGQMTNDVLAGERCCVCYVPFKDGKGFGFPRSCERCDNPTPPPARPLKMKRGAPKW